MLSYQLPQNLKQQETPRLSRDILAPNSILGGLSQAGFPSIYFLLLDNDYSSEVEQVKKALNYGTPEVPRFHE